MSADVFSLDYVRDRVMHGMEAQHATSINLLLEELTGAMGDGDLAAVSDIAGRLRDLVGVILSAL